MISVYNNSHKKIPNNLSVQEINVFKSRGMEDLFSLKDFNENPAYLLTPSGKRTLQNKWHDFGKSLAKVTKTHQKTLINKICLGNK